MSINSKIKNKLLEQVPLLIQGRIDEYEKNTENYIESIKPDSIENMLKKIEKDKELFESVSDFIQDHLPDDDADEALDIITTFEKFHKDLFNYNTMFLWCKKSAICDYICKNHFDKLDQEYIKQEMNEPENNYWPIEIRDKLLMLRVYSLPNKKENDSTSIMK